MALRFTMLSFLLLLVTGSVWADEYKYPVNICTNSITPNVSKFMHAEDTWEVYYASKARAALSALHYTGPTMKNATYIPDKPRRHLQAQKPDLLIPQSLSKVHIDENSKQGIAQRTNLEYLLMLEPDRLVYNFRIQAGLPAPASPYGGWEAPDKELRGHFVGHYLSASAFAWAYSRNETLYSNMNQVVDALAECQQNIGNGYLSAFPEELLDRFEMLLPVWAPYYTLHKIMAGLLDQFVHAGNTKAFRVLLWMAQYFHQRVSAYIEKYTIESHYQALNEEFGGFNELMYNLYRITGDPAHLQLAHWFDKPCFLGLLAMQSDSLSGFHANTHLPVVIGAQMRYELIGDETYRMLTEYFLNVVNSSHMYATGGTSVQEFWSDPKRLATALTHQTEETCATYNLLKVSRNLFRWTQRAEYSDYYERAMVNGIMSIQRGTEPGVMIYMLPLMAGTSKAESDEGWGTPFDKMWCCYGTGIESFAKLGDSIYFIDNGVKNPDDVSTDPPTPGLFVIQFVSSTISWDAVGLKLQQKVEPLTSYNPVLRMTLEFVEDEAQNATDAEAVLNIRIPSWTTSDCSATFNNDNREIEPGSFLTIKQSWKVGDQLSFNFPATITTEHIKDDRAEYADLMAVFFGPYLLAGMSSGDSVMTPPKEQSSASAASWILSVDPASNGMLYSFGSSALGEGVFLGHNSSGSLVFSSNKTGTDWDSFSTFRVVPAITDCSEYAEDGCFNSSYAAAPAAAPAVQQDDSSPLAALLKLKLVSLELMDQPRMFVAQSGINQEIVVRSVEDLSSESSGINKGSAVFNLVPGLSGDEGTLSLEAAGVPGCYLVAPAAALGGSVQLQCMPEGEMGEFHKLASFSVNKGNAVYNPMSFVAQADNRAYLMFPLADYKDEHYTVYFDMKQQQ